jgi:hypothetical protein
MDWVITLPRTVDWEEYEKELAAVADGKAVLNYRVRGFPKDMKPRDRCFLVWKGQVRGWMRITGLVDAVVPWKCEVTYRKWPAGKYIQRSGEFHRINGPKMVGFRGVRKYEGE